MEKYLINTNIGGVQIPVYKDDWGISVADDERVSYTTYDAIPEKLKSLLELESGLEAVVAASDTSKASLISENLAVKSGGPWYLTIRVDSSGTVFVPEEARVSMGWTKIPNEWNNTHQVAGYSAIHYVKNNIGTRTYILIGDDDKYYMFLVPYPADRVSSSAPARFTAGGFKTATYPVTLNSMMSEIVLTKAATGGGGAGGPTSKPGGGGGTFDNTNDDVTAPDYTNNPIAGMIAAGTIGVYVPTKVQMAQFSSWLWSTDVYDVLVKLKDPMDYIIKLGIIPCEVTQKELSSFSLGTVFSQNFQMYKSLTQIITYDLGTIQIPEYWGNALDYAPNTRIQIFLPFIGYQNLQTDDVMGASINLKYNIDIITGACVAIVTVARENISQVLYQYNGQCMMSVPLTGRTTQIDFGQIVGAVGGIAAGNYVAAGIAAAGTLVNSGPIRQNVARSGNISGITGFCGVLRPYIVINRGVQSLPEGYQTLNGYPSNITAKLSTLTGFTKISKIHLEGFSATEDELDEIERMLQEGVIL